MDSMPRSTSKSPGGVGEVLLLSYPTAITMLSYTVVGLADAAMVGRLGAAVYIIGISLT